MKKLILVLAVLFVTAASVSAQDKHMSSDKKFGLDIAANIGFPTSTGYSIAYGADLQGNIAAAEQLKITVSVGYENYSIKSSYGGGNGYFIPLLGGVKYNFSSKFYGHAQLGYGIAQGGGGAFGYAPSVGYNVSSNLDLSVKYLAFSKNSYTLGAVLFRLAYTLGK